MRYVPVSALGASQRPEKSVSPSMRLCVAVFSSVIRASGTTTPFSSVTVICSPRAAVLGAAAACTPGEPCAHVTALARAKAVITKTMDLRMDDEPSTEVHLEHYRNRQS